MLLACEALETTKEDGVFRTFQRLFAECGLPNAIRSDNGLPFASPNGLYNLSKLSVWWLRLGIALERIRPGHPQQNGRHERMHLTLKKEATRPPGMNCLQQQARFDDFLKEFNTERPHEALAMKVPGDIYTSSAKPYAGLPDLDYPFHDNDILVTACGRICMHRKKVNISTVMAGQRLGIKEVDEGIWLVSFMQYDLGYIDLEQKTLQTIDNPHRARGCHPCLRDDLLPMSPVWTWFIWCRLRDSNPRPTVYKTVALPTELSRPHDISQLTEICGPALSRQAKSVRCQLAGPPFLTTGLRRRRQSRNSRGMPLAPSSNYPIGGLRYLWIACTTTEPSPTPEATRLTEPERTSPTANTPGRDVPKGEPP